MDRAVVRNLFLRNLKRFRGVLQKSQLDLAADTGLAPNFINDIENGKKFVSDDTIAKLATALKVEPYQFFLPERLWDTREEDILTEEFSESLAAAVRETFNSYINKNYKKEPGK